MNKQQIKSETTKKQIIKAVRNILKQKNLSDMKIREICKEAGIAVGTFYLYFPCKEAAVLYAYREADLVFENLKLNKNPMDNIKLILKTYLSLVDFNNIDIVKQIYICHLSYHDSYFFNEHRVIYTMLNQEINKYLKECSVEYDSKNITFKILEFARGNIYNLCIMDSDINKDKWTNDKLIELISYFDFIVSKLK